MTTLSEVARMNARVWREVEKSCHPDTGVSYPQGVDGWAFWANMSLFVACVAGAYEAEAEKESKEFKEVSSIWINEAEAEKESHDK